MTCVYSNSLRIVTMLIDDNSSANKVPNNEIDSTFLLSASHRFNLAILDLGSVNR